MRARYWIAARRLRNIDLHEVVSPAPCHFLTHKSNASPQHAVLKHHALFLVREAKFLTHENQQIDLLYHVVCVTLDGVWIGE
jgi:hypothetical protein